MNQSWQEVRALAGNPQQFAAAFTRFARALVRDRGDGAALQDLIAALEDAKSLPTQLRRHVLIVAAREAILGDEQQHNWVREFGCDEYMKLEWDPSLVDAPPHGYWFAEFLCYVNARLRGHNAMIMDVLPPGGTMAVTTDPAKHGMSRAKIEDILGKENLAKLPHYPELWSWWQSIQD